MHYIDSNGKLLDGWMFPPYNVKDEYPKEGKNYFYAEVFINAEICENEETYLLVCKRTREQFQTQYHTKKLIDPNGAARIAIFYSCKINRRVGFDSMGNKIDQLKCTAYFNAPLLSDWESYCKDNVSIIFNEPNNFPKPTDPSWIDWRAK